MIAYARSIGSRNPLYTDLAHGHGTFYGAQVAYPTFLYCIDDTFIAPKLPGIQAIYAGCTWEWFFPIRADDAITATARLVDVQEKEGEFCGPMVLQIGEVVYTNQYGKVVARATPRVLRTPRDAARARGKYADLGRHPYTQAEFAHVLDSYEVEEVRGEDARYWETVQEGDTLTPVVKGPLTTEDMNMYVGIVRGTLFFRSFLAHWRKHPADVFWDPDTGMPDSWDSSLLRDATAREFGFPGAHDAGSQRISWLDNLITNWMGDLGFLRRLDVRLVRPNLHGDTTWAKGRVTGKRQENGQFLVDLDVWCENQRGEVTATGSAVVALVAKQVDTLPPVLILPEGYDPFRGLPTS
jgi:acyl dehydratase